MKKKLLFVVKIFALIGLLVYSITSVKYTFNWFDNYSALDNQLQYLKQQQDELLIDIEKLKIKVTGLQEETINLDILEVQSKNILQMQDKDEKVFIR